MISTVHTGGPLEMALTIALSLFDDIVVETKKQFRKKIIKGICLCVDEWFQEQVLAIAKPHTVIIEPSISLLGVSTSEKQQIKPNTKQFIALRDSYWLQTVFICLSTLDYLQFAFQFLCVILRCFFCLVRRPLETKPHTNDNAIRFWNVTSWYFLFEIFEKEKRRRKKRDEWTEKRFKYRATNTNFFRIQNK